MVSKLLDEDQMNHILKCILKLIWWSSTTRCL